MAHSLRRPGLPTELPTRLLVLLVLLLSPSGLLADDTAVGPWKVKPLLKDGKLSYCFGWRAAEVTRQGGLNSISIGPDGIVWVNLETPTWTLPAGGRYPLKITVGSISRDLSGGVINPKNLSIVIGTDTELMTALRAANTLEITGAAASVRADYTGAGPALDALVSCVRDHTPGASNPFAPPENPQSTNPFAPKN